MDNKKTPVDWQNGKYMADKITTMSFSNDGDIRISGTVSEAEVVFTAIMTLALALISQKGLINLDEKLTLRELRKIAMDFVEHAKHDELNKMLRGVREWMQENIATR